MANIRVSELIPTATLPAGAQLLLAIPSPTVTQTASTISFSAADKSLNDSGGGLVAAGFVVGDQVRVTGASSAGNTVFSAAVTAVSAGKLVLGAPTIVDEAAGASVTVAKWVSVRIDRDTLVSALGDASAAARSTVTALAINAGVVDIDCALGEYFTLALTANVTSITFSHLPASGRGASLMIRITQDGTPRTVAWPGAFKWAGGSAGAVSTDSGATDLLAITTLDAGTTWNATLGKAFA